MALHRMLPLKTIDSLHFLALEMTALVCKLIEDNVAEDPKAQKKFCQTKGPVTNQYLSAPSNRFARPLKST